EQMNLLGKRVLMHDTDSIVYEKQGEYQIPLHEGMLGAFESEGEFNGFVSWGPKSYIMRKPDGTESIKCKGVNFKRASRKLINFDVGKQMLFDGLDVNFPQFTIGYIMGEG